MGIAESISAVGIAGTVTGLSYTQATAQQKEDEEEARRAAEAAQAAAAPAGNNRNKQRAGADETGPSRGAFPVSGTLGGGGSGRGPGPGRQNGSAAAVRGGGGSRKQDGGGRNTADRKDGRGGAGKRQAAKQSNRSDIPLQKKKKKEGNLHNHAQPEPVPTAEDNNILTSDPQEPGTVAASPVPGKSRRRGGGKKRDPSIPSQSADEIDAAIDSNAVATVQEKSDRQSAPAAPTDKGPARSRRNGNSKPNTRDAQSTNLIPTSSPPSVGIITHPTSAPAPVPTQDTSASLSHPSSPPQTSRNQSRARSRRPRGYSRNHNSATAPAPHQAPQAAEGDSSGTQAQAQPAATASGDPATMPKIPQDRGRGRGRGSGNGRGGRNAHVERSRPLVSSPQSNQPTV